ncbi:acyl-CoA carboxylase subunit epsilon [Couchioplanes caeruleus]|uniref:acyl-CoA carboxylase subunit epsilon n=1 Tax=Couchioplanes caeruleus TaxID=56438 RepID=UPI0020BD74C0|nr:acyl-CoA carboxylase subunit epsilon [Couchioplanes caeruleus]UQU65615.1 acyl-CoA carboxylase subunit epsilon [Couchioplanes caeruleus]
MEEEPLVSVVRGVPTPEELAALVGALASRYTGTDGSTAKPSTSPWTRSARRGAGRGSWRDSGLPR